MTGPSRVAAAVALAVGLATGATAYVSAPERIHDAIAETNKADGREQAVRLELTMQIGERPSVATGELISHPTGLARLELRGAGGLLERHLLQGNEHTVTRNGEPLDDPRAFLPPFFILQADSGMMLRAALTSFAVEGDAIGLAECGDTDCLVIGDLARAIPRPDPPPVRGLDAWVAAGGAASALDPPSEADDSLRIMDPFDDSEPTAPRVWVETRSYEVRGFDDGEGVRVRLGPIASFDKLRVPAWISVEEPGRVPARFDVTGASLVTAPASAFTREWLYSPDTDLDAPTPDANPAD